MQYGQGVGERAKEGDFRKQLHGCWGRGWQADASGMDDAEMLA